MSGADKPLNETRVENLEQEILELIRTVNRSRVTELKAAFGKMHGTHQQMFVRETIIPILEQLAGDLENGYYDLRNEGSCRFASIALKARDEARIGLPLV